jgi:hypothetical protein
MSCVSFFYFNRGLEPFFYIYKSVKKLSFEGAGKIGLHSHFIQVAHRQVQFYLNRKIRKSKIDLITYLAVQKVRLF